jgi:hypothetical protein
VGCRLRGWGRSVGGVGCGWCGGCWAWGAVFGVSVVDGASVEWGGFVAVACWWWWGVGEGCRWWLLVRRRWCGLGWRVVCRLVGGWLICRGWFWVLQEGPAWGDSVVVATDRGVVRVGLDGGGGEWVVRGGGVRPVRPVVVGGCVRGAWVGGEVVGVVWFGGVVSNGLRDGLAAVAWW